VRHQRRDGRITVLMAANHHGGAASSRDAGATAGRLQRHPEAMVSMRLYFR
jgi:hypothetical protein